MTTRRVALALAALALGGALVGCRITGGGGTAENGGSPGGGSRGDETFEFRERIQTVVVRTEAASLEVEVGDGPIQVREQRRYSDEPPRTTRAVDGATLRLEENGCGDGISFGIHRCEINYRVRLPRDTAVDVETGAGSVSVRGLHGGLRVVTNAGRVRGVDLGSREVTVKADAGTVDLAFTRPPTTADIRTDAGTIEVRVPRDERYAIDARTMVGTARLDVPHTAGAPNRIVLESQAGAVSVRPA
ncbi:protein of unknown function (DUF4098) [Streptoalloteichus tenebrarius]|uniref:Adhesin domain-containing protein n=1 Tax=Streptoalloteichus tenebrarius (strain ATCC 17920 / DSM 40477 / JCM 4838 / CBS 697.72 / NBRC 16177 / NCIMB 11028 / NRRL B-12390 / A12253. 1 / ISP 5477) TaxID=1933 RepID=A0ABT1HTW9_STRSD|nr:DUF4097 domain-containing protein [Streptoalloteichus tenebrarius]MCP2258973.1 protein of unknown function (DUF4098) [Streptoalloteichus tenebrarius]BFF01182.1 hypothetical protein GCM10020241_28570 [Streptoalloteichus tenebrarius]